MPKFKTLDQLPVEGKRVLLRADLNVPMADGKVTDPTRIEKVAPTIEALLKRGAAAVAILAHFGRPKKGPDTELSLQPLLSTVQASIGGRPVAFADDCIGAPAKSVIDGLPRGGVALLENLRFHKEEEANDPAFARELAALGDLFVNDAFSAAHRAHASTEGIARLLPSAAGLLMQAELEALSAALEKPQRPLAALVGGAKVSTKIELLQFLVRKADVLVVGGAMANTVLFAQGVDVGRSLCERDMKDTALRFLDTAKDAGCTVVLPDDAIVAREFKAGAPMRPAALGDIAADEMILDIGPRTAKRIAAELERCRTLVWNGPMGAFEIPPFDAGTVDVARAAARLTQAGTLMSVAGGGDTLSALAHAGVVEQFSYVSTAGGAFLEWLEGRTLPGVAALEAAA